MARRIAYVMSRFPHLPETFILREMIVMQQLGWEVLPFPLVVQKPQTIHAEAKPWMGKVHHTSLLDGGVWAANIKRLLSHPVRQTKLFLRCLYENRSSLNFLMRALAIFPQATHAAAWMQREKIEHIHAHYATHPALYAWLIHQMTGIPYSVTVHAHDIFVRKNMLATKLRGASFIAAISEFNRAYLAREVGPWIREKTHIIHCGIDPRNYSTTPATRDAEAMNERFEIISIGSLQPYKGFVHLIDACAVLRDRGLNFRCRVIGGGELHDMLQQRIAAAKLGDCFVLLGPKPQDEVARLLATAHCYVQPSIITPAGKMEGIPVSLMEAMASGLPVVASRLSGIPELVRPGETGRLCEPENALSLADEITAVMADRPAATVLALRGRDFVLREFDLLQNVAALSAQIETIIGQTHPQPQRVESQIM